MQGHLPRFNHQRHVQGWQLGMVAIAIATLGVLLAAPLAVAPDDIPLPIADGAAIWATLQADKARAVAIVPILTRELGEQGKDAPLYDLRALGVALRAYGRAEARGDTYEVVRARQQLQEDVLRARALGDTQLLALRSYQGSQFWRELARYENSGVESEELIGLAGPFVSLMTHYGWMHQRVIAMDEELRSTFWKRRWNDLTGLNDGAFALTLDELRAFYAFLLRHPPADLAPRDASKTSRRAENEWLLRKVDELGRIDPTYPALLARGVLLYRLERYAASAAALRGYLGSAGDPPYALRARNYLMAAAERDPERP